jgi:hypothetical protein
MSEGSPASADSAPGVASPPEESFAAPPDGEPAEDAAFDFLVDSPPSAVEPALPPEVPPEPAAEAGEFAEEAAFAEAFAEPAETSAEAPAQAFDFEFAQPEEDLTPAGEQAFTEPAEVAAAQEPADSVQTPRPGPAVAPDEPAPPEPASEIAGTAAGPSQQSDVPRMVWEDLPPSAIPAWDAPDEIPQVEVNPVSPGYEESAALGQGSNQPSPAAPLAGIAPPDGEIPDFNAWSAVPTGNASASSDSGPIAPPQFGSPEEYSPLPAFPVSEASPWESSPAEEDEEDTVSFTPTPPPARPKPKKSWWPFGKDKAGEKKPGGKGPPKSESNLDDFLNGLD